jgi:hypothetical protein
MSKVVEHNKVTLVSGLLNWFRTFSILKSVHLVYATRISQVLFYCPLMFAKTVFTGAVVTYGITLHERKGALRAAIFTCNILAMRDHFW